MVVLGYVLYDDDELTLTSPTQAEYTAGCPRETFATTQVVNVTNTTAKELTATLDRIVARCSFVLTDEAIRPIYREHKGKFTTLCMFWVASKIFTIWPT